MKALTISIILLLTLNVFSQQPTTDYTIQEESNLVNLREAKYAGVSFENIINKYKGKVIYLDFWASWCRPCKNEMPYSKKMHHELKGKDVVFVYMSTDKDANTWKTSIAQLQVTGENYLINAKVWNEYNNLFKVTYIPRYVLIDKNGKVVDANAGRPSNPETVKTIMNLL